MTENAKTGTSIRTRAISVRAKTFNAEKQTVEAVIASDEPLMIYDFETRGFVQEILLPSGFKINGGRDSIPLLDSHRRDSVDRILGAATNLRREGRQIVADIVFDDSSEAKRAAGKVARGVVTDLSVGYDYDDPDDFDRINAGEKRAYDGIEYQGPAIIVKNWTLYEVSLVAIGADNQAMFREKSNHEKEESAMAEEKTTTATAEVRAETETRADRFEEGQRAERERVKAIRELANLAGLPADNPVVIEALDNGLSEAQARSKFSAEKAKAKTEETGDAFEAPATASVSMIRDGAADFHAAAVDSVLLRAGVLKPDKAHPGAREYRGHTMQDIARITLARNGVRGAEGLSQDRLLAALRGTRGFMARGNPASAQATGAFSDILADVAHKSAAIGLEESPTTYRRWCGIRTLSDLKPHYITRLGGSESLALVPESAEVPFGVMSDKKESLTPYAWAKRWGVTDQAIINDDLDLLASAPYKWMQAADRTVDEYVYYLLLNGTSLTLTEDSLPVFEAGTHLNYVTPGAAPSETTFTAAWTAISKKTGLNGKPLSLRFRYIIVPTDLEPSTRKYIGSEYEIAGTNQELNPFYNSVEIVATPLLSVGVTLERVGQAPLSGTGVTTGWYLACDPSQIETVIVGFVNGQGPVLEMERPLDYLGTEMRVKNFFGAGFGDWRGLYYNAGA